MVPVGFWPTLLLRMHVSFNGAAAQVEPRNSCGLVLGTASSETGAIFGLPLVDSNSGSGCLAPGSHMVVDTPRPAPAGGCSLIATNNEICKTQHLPAKA